MRGSPRTPQASPQQPLCQALGRSQPSTGGQPFAGRACGGSPRVPTANPASLGLLYASEPFPGGSVGLPCLLAVRVVGPWAALTPG